MKRVSLGIGCDRHCESATLAEAAEAALALAGVGSAEVAMVASIDLKQQVDALRDLARLWQVPLHFFTAQRLESETPRLATPSHRVFELMGCHGVAEAAALACVGPQGILLVPKQKARGVTMAVAGWL